MCVRCRQQATKDQITAPCLVCWRPAYCSEPCRDRAKTRFCCWNCKEENTDGAHEDVSAAEVAARGPLPDRSISSSRGRGRIEDNTNTNASTSQGDYFIHETDPLGIAPEEIEDQIKAMQAFEQKKLQSDYEIINYRIINRGRTLQYEIQPTSPTSSGVRRWVDVEELQSDIWTQRLTNFWFNNPYFAKRRRYILDPDQSLSDNETLTELPPYDRWIVDAEIYQHRELIFQVREFERGVDAGWEDDRYMNFAEQLGKEWDDAIGRYWRRVQVAEDWDERKKETEREMRAICPERKHSGTENVRKEMKERRERLSRVPRKEAWELGLHVPVEKKVDVNVEEELWPGMDELVLRMLSRSL